MKIPQTISRNAYEAYRCSVETVSLPCERERSIRAEDENWDERIIPDLKSLALRVIVDQWEANPILETLPTSVDRDALFEMLPTNLPFESMIGKIDDEIFWKRASKNRWDYNNPDEHGNSWRRLYVERHLGEYLENIDPIYFEQERESCNRLIELCQDFVRTMKVRSLIPSKSRIDWSGEEEKHRSSTMDQDPVDHLPFDQILPNLTKLEEVHLHFGMIYGNDNFNWRDFEFSIDDCKNLGSAIERCLNLKTLRLTRANLDHSRVVEILHGATANDRLVEIDFSHCKLGDLGARAIGQFLTGSRSLMGLHLANNYIGASGVQGLVEGVLKNSSAKLKHLNLRLNPLTDEGGARLCYLLVRYNGFERFNVSGCGLTLETGTRLAECIASGHLKFTSLVMDLSNNDFGPIAGEALEAAVKLCSSIVGLDARLCNFSKESEYSIGETVSRNKEIRRNAGTRSIRTESPSQNGINSSVPLENRDKRTYSSSKIASFSSSNDISNISRATSFAEGEDRNELSASSSLAKTASEESSVSINSKNEREKSK